MRTALISAGLLAGTTAGACVLEPASCGVPGGVAYFGGQEGSVVLFDSYLGQTERYTVVECTSRQALSIDRPANDSGAYWDASSIISDAVFDAQPQTLRDVAGDIRRETGLEARLFTLSAGHCGCDLPNIPPPPSYCPTFD